MRRNRPARSETVRLPIRDGDWIEVKYELCVGDTRGPIARVLREEDFQSYRVLNAKAWLVDWSLRDAQDRPLPLTEAALNSLTIETFNELYDAIDAHHKATQEEVAKTGDPSSPAGATRSSPAAPDSPSSTSPGSTSPSAG
jgi:hypothetical protein